MPRIDGQTVLITGASSGIGRAIARTVAPRAKRITLVARREERLRALQAEFADDYGVDVIVETADLSDWEMVKSLARDARGVDVLVNNAGIGHEATVAQSDPDRLRQMVRVNILALTELTRSLLPPMIEQGRGGILNIGSGAGLIPLPGAAAYAGTKHYVHGFTEALREEVAGTGVTVTEVCPGPVRTEFSERAETDDEDASGLPGPLASLEISAEACARAAIEGFEAGRELVFPGAAYGGVMTMQEWLPRPLVRWMMRQLASSA